MNTYGGIEISACSPSVYLCLSVCIRNIGNFLLQTPTVVLKVYRYSITCIQRPLKGSNESVLLQLVVSKCRFYKVNLRRVVVSEQWSFTAGRLLIQVVSNTELTVH